MSTASSTNSASTKTARNQFYSELVADLSMRERAELSGYLMKDIEKSLTKTGRAKRAPKLDEEGNVIKKPLSPGVVAWNAYVNHLKAELTELYPGTKILRKACLRLGKLLKAKGEAADEGENSFYPAENLSTESLQEEWDAWYALPDEEKYADPKAEESDSEEDEPKAKKAAAKKGKAATSDSEEQEKPKPKARGRPKKASPLDEEEEEAVQSSTESKASKKSSKSAKAKAAEEEEEPKPKKVAKKAKAEESDDEEPKPKASAQAPSKKASKSKKE